MIHRLKNHTKHGYFGQNRKFKRFSAQKQVISKKKKKKRSFPKLRRIFRPKSEIKTVFQAESRQLLHDFGTQIPLGGCFYFFSKNRPQKHQKRAILHTLQANGGARAPLPPPLATLLAIRNLMWQHTYFGIPRIGNFSGTFSGIG